MQLFFLFIALLSKGMGMKAGVTYLYCTRNASLWRKEGDTSIHSKAGQNLLLLGKFKMYAAAQWMIGSKEFLFLFLLLFQYINYISHAGVSYKYKRDMASTCVMYRALKENTVIFRRGHHEVPPIKKKVGGYACHSYMKDIASFWFFFTLWRMRKIYSK